LKKLGTIAYEAWIVAVVYVEVSDKVACSAKDGLFFAEKFGIILAGGIFASEFGVAPWTKERAWSAVRARFSICRMWWSRAIYQHSRAALASVSETTDALVGKIRKAFNQRRAIRISAGGIYALWYWPAFQVSGSAI
jgi:hypothetical protein